VGEWIRKRFSFICFDVDVAGSQSAVFVIMAAAQKTSVTLNTGYEMPLVGLGTWVSEAFDLTDNFDENHVFS
jgi:hypothetical protein